MRGLKAVASYIPGNYVDNLAQGESFGEDRAFIENKIGATRLPRKPAEQDTSDMAVEAVRRLLESEPSLTPEAIDALVVVTQNPDGDGLPHTSAIVQDKLGLPTRVAAFDVSLGCSGYVYGLYLMKGFLEASGLRNGLLVTADPYSKVLTPGDRVTALLFGDAATASWIGPEPDWTLGEVAYGTDGSGAAHLICSGGRLSMNGRQVFNFAATKVAPHIRGVIEKAGLTAEEIDAFLIHQGSGAIVDAVSRRFGENKGRFVLDMADTGNTVSSTIPLLLQRHAFASQWRNVLISGFGVGLSWASAVLHRSEGNRPTC